MTKQDTIRQGKSPHIKAGHGNQLGGNKLDRVPQNYQANSHHIYAEDLVQRRSGGRDREENVSRVEGRGNCGWDILYEGRIHFQCLKISDYKFNIQ